MFENFTASPADPILQLIGLYQADERADKIDVGVGVFRDANGLTPIMQAVRIAEQQLHESQTTKAYVGLAGDENFNTGMRTLIFGEDADYARIGAVQTPGGCGALRMLADMLYRIAPDHTIWLSEPTWGNHYPIFRASGFQVATYPYLDRATKTVDRDQLMSKLQTLGARDIVVLHGCCHNPSGAELTPADWDAIAQLAARNGFLPFFDLAYQGFGDDLTADAYSIRAMATQVESMVVASSCSKNFGLYRDRVGCALLMGRTQELAELARGHVLSAARSAYSMPPDHGAALVALILHDATLRQTWHDELTAMRARMLKLRREVSDALRQQTNSARWDFIAEHRGMFSLLVLDEAQVTQLREEHAVYAVAGGRINVAGLRDAEQVARFATALVAVTEPDKK